MNRMFYSILLSTHLAAAAASIGAVSYALYILWKSKAAHYRPMALGLGALAGFEVATGTLLAFISQELLAVSLTLHIAIYLGICAATEVLLLRRIQYGAPTKTAFAPMVASAGFFAAAVLLGF